MDGKGQGGQATVEYVGLVLLVALLLAGLLMLDPRSRLGRADPELCRLLTAATCETGPLGSAAGAFKFDPCLGSYSLRRAGAEVGIPISRVLKLRAESGSSILREDFGTGSRLTIAADAGVAAELGLAEPGSTRHVKALLGARGQLTGAVTYELDNAAEADALEAGVRASGGFAGVARNVAGSSSVLGVLPGGIGDTAERLGVDVEHALLDLVGVERDAPRPEPDSRYIESGVSIHGEAEVTVERGEVAAEVRGAIDAAGGARVTTAGEGRGDAEVYIEIEAGAAARLAAQLAGAEALGLSLRADAAAEATAVATLALDGGDAFTPVRLELSLSASHAASGALNGSLAGRTVPAAVVGSGPTERVELAASLDLGDPTLRSEALAAIASIDDGPAAATGELAELLRRHGVLRVQTFTIQAGADEYGLPGIVGGARASESGSSDVAHVRAPGGEFIEQSCVQAAPATVEAAR